MNVGALLYRALRSCPAPLRKGLLQRLPLRIIIDYYAAAGIGVEQLAREGFKVPLDPTCGLTPAEQILDYAAIQGSRAEFAGFLLVHPVVTLWNLVRGRFIGTKEEFDTVVRESLPVLAYTCVLYSHGQRRTSRLGRILHETLFGLGPYGLSRLLGPSISANRDQVVTVLCLLVQGGYSDLFSAVLRGYAGVLSADPGISTEHLYHLIRCVKNPAFAEALRQQDFFRPRSEAIVEDFYRVLAGEVPPLNSESDRSGLTVTTVALILSSQWGSPILGRLRQRLPRLLPTFQLALGLLNELPEPWSFDFSLPTDLQSYVDADPAMSTIFFFLAGVLNRREVLDNLLNGELRKIILYHGDDHSGLVNLLLFFQTEAFQHPRIQTFLSEIRRDIAEVDLVEVSMVSNRLQHNPEIIRQLHWLLDYRSLSPIGLPADLARHPKIVHMLCYANMLLAFEPDTLAGDLLREPDEHYKPWSLRRKLLRADDKLYYSLVGTSFHCSPTGRVPARTDLQIFTGLPRGEAVGSMTLVQRIVKQDGLDEEVSPFQAIFGTMQLPLE